MRYLVIAVIGLAAGFILGGLGPRGEIRTLETQVAELQKKLDEKPKGLGLANMIKGLPTSSARRFDDKARSEGVKPADKKSEAIALAPAKAPTAQKEDAPAEAPEAVAEGDDLDADGGNPMERFGEERMDEAKTVMEARRAQARAALMERADLEDWQEEQFDEAIDGMNDQLEDFVVEFADILASGEEPSRREAMQMAAGVLDIVLETDAEIGGILNEDQLQAAGDEALDPLSYLDPELLNLVTNQQ